MSGNYFIFFSHLHVTETLSILIFITFIAKRPIPSFFLSIVGGEEERTRKMGPCIEESAGSGLNVQ